MTTPVLTISADDVFAVTVRRNAWVADVLWTKVRTEWGFEGDPQNAIKVPVDLFLSNLEWLLPYCIRFQTGVDWSESARALVARASQERSSLDGVRKGVVSLTTEQVEDRLLGTRFTRTLREFQIRDLGKLLVLPNGANFSVPGAGKTTVTYALYEAERHLGKVDRLLVVSPLSAFDAWVEEAVECFDGQNIAVHRLGKGAIPAGTEVVLVNYQRLHRAYRRVTEWAKGGQCHVVLDEAHRMKRGWAGQWGRASLSLAYFAARRDVLTGTPAPQGLRDLDAILDFAWPTQARRILPSPIFQSSPPQGLAAQTGTAIKPLFVRTTKSDLKLRKPIIEVQEFPLQGLQKEIYTALRNQYAGQLALARSDRNSLARMGKVTMYLLEAATNPGLLPLGASSVSRRDGLRFPLQPITADTHLIDLIANYTAHEIPPKFATLATMVRANADQGRKTLIWTNFVDNIAKLEDSFRALQPAAIHGGILSNVTAPRAARTREAELARFRNDPACSVLIANPAATSEGVSLHHDCHDAIYLDRTFNAGHYLQSIDRIHRLGMRDDVETRITILATLGTVDVTVDNQVEAKAQRLGDILSDQDIGAMALPDDEDYREPIAEDDLPALFAHLRGEDADQKPAKR